MKRFQTCLGILTMIVSLAFSLRAMTGLRTDFVANETGRIAASTTADAACTAPIAPVDETEWWNGDNAAPGPKARKTGPSLSPRPTSAKADGVVFGAEHRRCDRPEQAGAVVAFAAMRGAPSKTPTRLALVGSEILRP